jgi:cell wall-associated NlpC family hydrolase
MSHDFYDELDSLDSGNPDYADDVMAYISFFIDEIDDVVFQAMMKEALKYQGWPYVWAGDSPDTGFDCSGLMQWIFSQAAGVSIPRTAQSQYNFCDLLDEDDSPVPGDLVFFTGTYDTDSYITHVGLYIGGNMMYHAGDPIGYANLEQSYYKEHFVCYGRVTVSESES